MTLTNWLGPYILCLIKNKATFRWNNRRLFSEPVNIESARSAHLNCSQSSSPLLQHNTTFNIATLLCFVHCFGKFLSEASIKYSREEELQRRAAWGVTEVTAAVNMLLRLNSEHAPIVRDEKVKKKSRKWSEVSFFPHCTQSHFFTAQSEFGRP